MSTYKRLVKSARRMGKGGHVHKHAKGGEGVVGRAQKSREAARKAKESNVPYSKVKPDKDPTTRGVERRTGGRTIASGKERGKHRGQSKYRGTFSKSVSKGRGKVGSKRTYKHEASRKGDTRKRGLGLRHSGSGKRKTGGRGSYGGKRRMTTFGGRRG
jgi:hypothetical protein